MARNVSLTATLRGLLPASVTARARASVTTPAGASVATPVRSAVTTPVRSAVTTPVRALAAVLVSGFIAWTLASGATASAIEAPDDTVAAADPIASAPLGPPNSEPAEPTNTEPANTEPTGTEPLVTRPPISANDFIPDDENLTTCIGVLERPGCGSESRGGWHQRYVLIALLIGMIIVFGNVARGVHKRDSSTPRP